MEGVVMKTAAVCIRAISCVGVKEKGNSKSVPVLF